MNDSPGWAPPGPSPSDGPTDDAERATGQGTPPRQWSSEQPPAAHTPDWGHPATTSSVRSTWAPPSDAIPHPQTGQEDWQHGWHQPPPAGPSKLTVPQPGVVPLRPLTLAEILEAAIKAVRLHWRTALGVSLGVAVLTQAVITVLTGVWQQDPAELEALTKDPHPSPHQLLRTVSLPLLSTTVEAVVRTIGTALVTAVVTIVVGRAVLGRSASLRETWNGTRFQLLRLLGLLFLIPLMVSAVVAIATGPGLAALAAGSVSSGAALTLLGLTAGTVVAIWLWVQLSLATPALMLEKQGISAALRRSAKLVRGSWWRVMGIQLLVFAMLLVVTSVVALPATVFGTYIDGEGLSDLSSTASAPSWSSLIASGIASVIAYTLTFPVSAAVTALLYLDQRIRRESLDLPLARAATRNSKTAGER